MLRLNSIGRRDFTVGEMVNLMSVDAQKCNDLMVYLNMLWSGPFQIVVCLGFLYQKMGWSIFVGFVYMVLTMPFNIWIMKKSRGLQSKQMKYKDLRSKIMNEILGGIKVIKLYAWEESFMQKVMGYRKDELNQLQSASRLNAFFTFTMACSPFLVSLFTFTAYVYAGNELTAEKAFVAIALFNILRFPLSMFPVVLNNVVQYTVSAKRLTDFLQGDELDPDIVNMMERDEQKAAITIQDASFSWDNIKLPVLKDIDLQVDSGSLVAVVGQVGTGKSTLLSSILGEVLKSKGKVELCGSVAYVPQQPWIQNKTLQENVLFESGYIAEKYNCVVDACALRQDLSILPGGDMTEIGEKGINLSGGQKQRVSLARAVYANADVYLLDDPLSAVDVHVGKHLFDNVIGPEGLLKNKVS